MPDRPSLANCYTDAYLEENDEDSDKALQTINSMITAMKSKKGNSLPTKYWALDAFSHHTWRHPHQKNQLRDFRRFATAAYYEQSIVADYRQDLLDSSDVAKYLRTSLANCLSTFYKAQNTIYRGKTVMRREYTFPDPCKITVSNVRPDFDITEVIADNDKIAYITKANKNIMSLKKILLNHAYAKVAPSSRVVDPTINSVINILVKVCPSSRFSLPSSHSPLLQRNLRRTHTSCRSCQRVPALKLTMTTKTVKTTKTTTTP